MKLTSRNSIGNACLRPVWIFLILFMVFGAFNANASDHSKRDKNNAIQQSVKISGTIVDETDFPLPGVSIVVQGTTTGTVTDVNGNFNLEVPLNSVVVVSYIGFGSQEFTISGEQTEFNIILIEETENLEEVVVVGYGVQKKETVTGSLSSVSSDELVAQPVSSVSQALAGRLPGLIANQSGGRPGKDGATIKIRGIGTLDSGAGSNPLILIDGIERDQNALNFLDPNEIENLSILKDASSTAVFGVRGANGVILVTTKRGKTGPAKINYKGSMAVMAPSFKIDPIDSYAQTGLVNEYMGFAVNSTDPTAPYPQSIRDRFKGVADGNPLNPSDPYFYPSTNYADLMLKDYALQQQHNITIGGGTERLKYFASLGYFNQQGMFENLNPNIDKSTSYKRYNYRTNIDVNITKTTLAKVNIGGSFNENISLGQAGREPAEGFYWNMLVHSSPWDGYVKDDKVVLLQDNANSVLLNSDMRGYTVELQNTADYSIVLDQKLDFITKGLSVKGTVSLVSYFQNFIRRDKDEKKRPYWRPYLNEDESVTLYQVQEDVLPYNSTSQSKTRKEYYELALNYNRSFNGGHNVTALALVNADKSHFTESYWNEIPRAYLGVVGRVTYNYANKYMLEYNLGYNGSENFAEGKRFGFFPAVSAGWTFTEENWLKNIIGEDVLSYGKFRFSYGLVGNDRMSQRFLYLPDKYVMNNYSYYGWRDTGINFGLPGSMVNYPMAYQGAAGNPNVTWETSTKINYGADLNFLEGKLSAKFDYFTEDRKDILINQQVVPIYQQTGELALNLGHVENSGYEVEVGWNQMIKDTKFWVNLNYSFARNKILEMDEPQQPYEYRMQTGRRVGEMWGYLQEDFFRTEAEANAYRDELWATYSSLNPGADKGSYQAYQIFTAGHDVSAGDLKFIDRNNDGLINNLDEGYLDTPSFPETMFGLNTGFEHKGFSFSVLLQGASNYSINTRTNYNPTPNKGTILDFVMDRYTPEKYAAGESIKYPRLLNTNDNWKYAGTYWIKDATYLRLKNVELGYTFDSDVKLIKDLGLSSFRIFANGMDLLTFTKIENIDPETTNGVLRYPRSRVFNLGVNVQF
ncbi:TonB-dependent receptor [uncultured Draconibacterium sp.]|uniref:SusC/RagA family TonB-linked outer membrane protein n=1 Tax=uncultured Draconibacterium sp. TaxID=1573823 RepID=UPI002AA60EAE|nr:TonB-dependent receptor [uncultured Draconibacterium sp.]